MRAGMLVVVVLLVFLLVVSSGCVQVETETGEITVSEKVDDLRYCKGSLFDGCRGLAYIMKEEYISGTGSYKLTKGGDQCYMLPCHYVYIKEYEWESNGYDFEFVDDRSFIGGGNYVTFEKNLTIYSTDDVMLKTETYPFLACDYFVYDPFVPSIYFEINKYDGKTHIRMWMNTGRPRSYEDVLEEINEKFTNCNESIT